MRTILKTLVSGLFSNWTVITKRTYLQPAKLRVVKKNWPGV